METKTTKALITLINTAFDGLDPPLDDELLHPDCMDDVDILEFYGGIRWPEMTDQMIIHGYAAPTAFSAKAFQYYLPAYLIWTLRNSDSPEYANESILLALDPGTSKEMLHDFRKSKFSLLTPEQKEVVARVLHYFADHPDLGEFAEMALVNYWMDVELQAPD
ncbi:DUF6714 family protein [uncultured Ruegeria sp.]|uniref:DUF6714 family protein n=1 Tax=uncultured Ruegeria sp. TaxID=259304 RepID=UPI00260AC7EE|nr:DUF6714 family protein [uncultured Ruegeria sp.]